MQLNLTPDFVKQVLESSPKSSDLGNQLAAQLLASIDQQAMATYLLTKETAVSLLAQRLQSDPVGTIKVLQDLPERLDAPEEPARRGRKKKAAPGAPKKAKTAAKPQGRKAKAKGKRQRLTEEQAADLKKQVCTFLKENGWSTRKELTSAVDLSTQSIYRRIMDELQEEGVVIAKGTKATAVYGVK